MKSLQEFNKVIIENKLKRCKQLNIDADLSYLYKEDININEIEIAVIIGNILDNAIEACQKLITPNKEIWGNNNGRSA